MLTSSIEILEARIAPAAILHLKDFDGDLITITSSKGSNAELDAAVKRTAAGVVGGFNITEIDFSTNAGAFDGTSLSVTAVRGPDGGDGFVNVVRIDAIDDEAGDGNINLGTVVIDGDLRDLDAGFDFSTTSIKSLTVQSTSTAAIWTINGNVGALVVKGDLRGSELNIGGNSVGPITIAGALIGESAIDTGQIDAPNAKIGPIKIGHGIEGGSGDRSGTIFANTVVSLTVGGSLIGGGGPRSGVINGTHIGPVKIAGSVRGGSGGNSAVIDSSADIASIFIGGDFAGGVGPNTARILAEDFAPATPNKLGPVTILGSVIGTTIGSADILSGGPIGAVKIGGGFFGGAAGDQSARISAATALGAVTIGGDMVGGAQQSASIVAQTIVSVKIAGDLRGGAGTLSGNIEVADASPTAVGKIGPVTIGGSIIGDAMSTASIISDGEIGALMVRGDVTGSGEESAEIFAKGKIASVTIGGSLIGGAGPSSGVIGGRAIGAVKIGGDVRGGAGNSSGAVQAQNGSIASVTIGGSLISGSIGALNLVPGFAGALGPVVIKGDVIGTSARPALIAANGTIAATKTDIAISSLTIGGRAEFMSVLAGLSAIGNPDAQIGAVKVGGDWIASTILAGVDDGADNLNATSDDMPQMQPQEPDALFSKIASITIGGAIRGTSGVNTDHFGFVAQEIGSFSVGGTKVALMGGHSNDNVGTNLPTFEFGISGDVTLREI